MMYKKLLNWFLAAGVIISIACNEITSTRHPVQQSLPIALPSIPMIQVKMLFSGADVTTLLHSIASPLKDSIFHYIRRVDYMSYTAGSDGSLTVNVYLKQGTDPDKTALDISNLVAVVTSQLPSGVTNSGTTVLKQNEALVMAVDIYSEDAVRYNRAFLTNYAEVHVIPELQRIQGISHLISVNDDNDSLLRIWLNKAHLTLGLTLEEVITAVPVKKLNAVTVIFYNNSRQTADYIIKCNSKRNQFAEYENLIVRTKNASDLKLKDLTDNLESGPHTYGNFTRFNGKPGINLAVMQVADSNYNTIQKAVEKLMEKVSVKFPAGVKYSMLYNPKDSLYIPFE